jgi:hypothetical protein
MISHFQRVVKEKPPVDIQFRSGLLCFPGTDPMEAGKLNRNLTTVAMSYSFSNRIEV